MTPALLARRTLCYYWRPGLLTGFGIAVATAVVTGSLLVGNSVTGSLRDNALARLGAADHALVSPTPFPADLAVRLRDSEQLRGRVKAMAPVLMLRGSARSDASDAVVPNVAVLGIDSTFGALYPARSAPVPERRDAVVNASLARDLGLRAGDYLLITVGRTGGPGYDSLFAHRRRADLTSSLRARIAAILPDAGPGGFGLDAATTPRRNVFVSREWLSELLGRGDSANVLLAAWRRNSPNDRYLDGALRESCQLADYGLRLAQQQTSGYLALESDCFTMPQTQALAVRQELSERASGVSVYLATEMRCGHRSIPYSMIAAIDGGAEPPEEMNVGRTGVVLNAWAAQQLAAQIGDRIDLDYLVPSADGAYRTNTAQFTVRTIIPMRGTGADPTLTPSFRGITDAHRIGDWRPPFPVDMSRITRRDEDYWNRYRAAPKAFVDPEVLNEMWAAGSPGPDADWITSLRISLAPESGLTHAGTARITYSGPPTAESLSRRILARLDPADSGLVFRPVRRLALQAAEGSTEFSALFLGLGSFLVIAGAGLAATLMRLTVQRRAFQTGILLACGVGPRIARRALVWEALALALVGAAAGAMMGVAYAGLILHGLRSWWSPGEGAGILDLHVSAGSVAAGFAIGLGVGMIALLLAIRGQSGRGVLELLGGWAYAALKTPGTVTSRRAAYVLALLLAVAGTLSVFAVRRTVAPESAFFGVGALLLASALTAGSLALTKTLGRRGLPTLGRLSARNAAVHRAHSLLAAGLLASSTFLLVAVGANARGPAGTESRDRGSGAGGFSLIATSAVPIPADFGAAAGRSALGFALEDEGAFQGVSVISLPMSSGEDASCLNLSKPLAPRILGATSALIRRGGFTVTTQPETRGNPWNLLAQATSGGETPVFGDSETVEWILKSGPGQKLNVPDESGRPLGLRFQGLISSSIFASDLLISESEFRRAFPSQAAPRYFLIETPHGREQRVAEALRRNLGDLGLDVRTTNEVLAAVAGVQNAWLSAFLALGGLGLILGTVGLAAVTLRSAAERSRELAIMTAQGFRRGSLAGMMLLEHGGLIVGGAVAGAVSALVAVGPRLAAADARVPWPVLALLIALVIGAGLLSCALAAAAGVRGNLVEALRCE